MTRSFGFITKTVSGKRFFCFLLLSSCFLTLASYFLLPASLNAQIDTAWVRRYNGPGNFWDEANSLAVDGQGNVYVTGSSVSSGTWYDYATIKYNSAGVEQWVQRYNGAGNGPDYAYSLAVDGQGNVYVTGSSVGSGTYSDYATIKYNADGQEQWVARYNGPGNDDDWARSPVVDGQGNVYVTGESYGSGTYSDYATIKYNANGVEQWVARYNGTGNDNDGANSLAVDGQGNVYVTGSSEGSGTSWDYATIKYVQAPGIEERTTLDATGRTLEIYPNPARSYLTIRLPQMLNQVQGDKMVVKIFDVSGKVIKVEELKGLKEQKVSLEGIKNGVYFVKVGDEVIKGKLIITR